LIKIQQFNSQQSLMNLLEYYPVFNARVHSIQKD
jgi:hypothetical protein